MMLSKMQNLLRNKYSYFYYAEILSDQEFDVLLHVKVIYSSVKDINKFL